MLLLFRIVQVNIASRKQTFIKDLVFKSLFCLRIHEIFIKSCKITSKLGNWNDFKVVVMPSMIILKKSLKEIKTCLLTKIHADERNSH